MSQITEILNLRLSLTVLSFDVDSIQSELIKEDADYQGVRIRFRGTLDSARINMQIDIGFGDIVHPSPEECDLPTMLDFTAPRLLCYSRESAIAEKFEAMVKLRVLNSRMKDFMIFGCSPDSLTSMAVNWPKQFCLHLNSAAQPCRDNIVAFQAPFIEEKQVQWVAFADALIKHLPKDLADVVAQVTSFLVPIIDAVRSGQPFDKTGWQPMSGADSETSADLRSINQRIVQLEEELKL